MTKGPLNGVRVLDASRNHSGPFATMLLADLGAEVIHIESPVVGDALRRSAGPRYHDAAYEFAGLQRNKKGIALDLGTPTGKEAFLDLVKVSDTVVDDSGPGVMEGLGLGYDVLKKTNPRVIVCSITPYGSTGPYAGRAGDDLSALALSGLLSLVGEPGRMPVRPGIALGDIAGGLFAAAGLISALGERADTGAGTRIEVNLLDSCLYLMGIFFTHYSLSGQIAGPQGGRHLAAAPFGVYPTKDSYITLGTCWPRIGRALGVDHIIDDPRFASADKRVENRKALEDIIEDALAKASTADWMEIMNVEDIAAAPLNNLPQAVNDPQVVHNHAVVELGPDSEGRNAKVVASPIKTEGKTEGKYERAPALGEHTFEVLHGLLGYSAERIRQIGEDAQKHAVEDRTQERTGAS